jgi:hypothetical protein
MENYQFFETVAYNQGYIVKVFKDIKEAMNWLNENRKISK